jgi:hypothetical protein
MRRPSNLFACGMCCLLLVLAASAASHRNKPGLAPSLARPATLLEPMLASLDR